MTTSSAVSDGGLVGGARFQFSVMCDATRAASFCFQLYIFFHSQTKTQRSDLLAVQELKKLNAGKITVTHLFLVFPMLDAILP